MSQEMKTCPICKGQGKKNQDCVTCKNTGEVEKGSRVKVPYYKRDGFMVNGVSIPECILIDKREYNRDDFISFGVKGKEPKNFSGISIPGEVLIDGDDFWEILERYCNVEGFTIVTYDHKPFHECDEFFILNLYDYAAENVKNFFVNIPNTYDEYGPVIGKFVGRNGVDIHRVEESLGLPHKTIRLVPHYIGENHGWDSLDRKLIRGK